MLVLLPTLLSEPNQCSDPMITPNDVSATKCPHPMPAPNTLTQCLHPVPTLSAALFPTPCSHLMLTPKVHYLASIQHQMDFSILESHWLTTHHPIPDSKFPPITAM